MENNKLLSINKPVYANENAASAYKAFDGNSRTRWKGGQYPGYIEVDLEAVCVIDKIRIVTPKNAYSVYSVFTSLDGGDYTEIIAKTSDDKCRGNGDIYEKLKKEARFVRVLVMYNSESTYAVVDCLEIYGSVTDKPCPEPKKIEIPSFDDSEYNVPVSFEDTYEEIRSIISRTIGQKYVERFELRLEADGTDYFELSDLDGKILIKGNNGVSICSGLNYYLKYFCNVSITQVGRSVTMPESNVPVGTTIRKQTPLKLRYAYNYCALSYTMAFWGEDEWRRELDWLALNGVNAVLDITAQEEVWRRFLTKLGYSHREIKSFIAGPAYYAWAYMANIYGVGGPVHDSWFAKRTRLARTNHLAMRKLGMQPVLQGFSGMAPSDIKSRVPDAVTISQGSWNGLPRPLMLRTDTDAYKRLAKLFYASQKETFGDCSVYFAADPFHEGGRQGTLKPSRVSECLLDSLLEYKNDAVWVIQSWGSNPSAGLIDGIGDRNSHAVVLDLYAEKRPRWESWLGGEFGSTPWAYCMLNNFGGRMGLHGHIDTICHSLADASSKAKHMLGAGITPEATFSNPVIFDLFFETWWGNSNGMLEAVEPVSWLKSYVRRRYGAQSDSAEKAMQVLCKTAYNAELNKNGEGAPESVLNARPAMKIKSASSWGNGLVEYNKAEFEGAVRLLLADYDKLKNSEGYQYDLADLTKQVLSNTAQEYHLKMVSAYKRKSLKKFEEYSNRFLKLAEMTNRVLSAQQEFLLGRWTNKALALAEGTDDYSKKLYLFNAKALITVWAGGRRAADDGGLRDYSNKQWSGLTDDLYKYRWKRWIDACKEDLSGGKSQKTDWFEIEAEWARDSKAYTDTPSGEDMGELAQQVLEFYSVEK